MDVTQLKNELCNKVGIYSIYLQSYSSYAYFFKEFKKDEKREISYINQNDVAPKLFLNSTYHLDFNNKTVVLNNNNLTDLKKSLMIAKNRSNESNLVIFVVLNEEAKEYLSSQNIKVYALSFVHSKAKDPLEPIRRYASATTSRINFR